MEKDSHNKIFNKITKSILKPGAESKPAGIARKIWLTRAVCLFLIIIAVILITVRHKSSDTLFQGNSLISAKDVAPLDSESIQYAGGSTTKAYFTRGAKELSDLMRSPVKDNSTIPALTVYQGINIDDFESYYENKKQKLLKNVKENLNLSLTPDADRNFGDVNFLATDLLSENFRIAVNSRIDYGITVTDYRIWSSDVPIQNLKLFGEDIVITIDEADETITNKLSEALTFANKAFDTQCEFQYVARDIEYTAQGHKTIMVYAYENSDDRNRLMYNQYFGQIVFLFMDDYDDSGDNEISLLGIYYSEYEIENAFLQDTELISVKDAESYLSSGYIFAGHVCPVCMSRNSDVDFADYDGVEIIYRSDSFGKYIIPFYAFYKQTGEHTYAEAYVPAVAVGGLKEYFEEQESWHNVDN